MIGIDVLEYVTDWNDEHGDRVNRRDQNSPPQDLEGCKESETH